MIRPSISIFDVTTQEETFREMNDAEYAQHQADEIMFEEQAVKQAELDAISTAKAVAKAELLATLNLSQETLDLLNGLN
jgi:hypothetical protein